MGHFGLTQINWRVKRVYYVLRGLPAYDTFLIVLLLGWPVYDPNQLRSNPNPKKPMSGSCRVRGLGRALTALQRTMYGQSLSGILVACVNGSATEDEVGSPQLGIVMYENCWPEHEVQVPHRHCIKVRFELFTVCTIINKNYNHIDKYRSNHK